MFEREDRSDAELEDDKLIDDADGETPETEEADEPELDDADGETPDADESEDDGELVVTIGDEKPEEEEEIPEGAPAWVKKVRNKAKEKEKENRELRKQLKSLQSANPAAPQREALGPKPKLADSDYDEAKHEEALDAWYEAKRQAEKAERDAADAQTAQQREWDARLQAHTQAKGALKVKGYDAAEEAVFEELDQTQQGILIGGASNSALVVYALAKNPKELKRLAAIKDPIKYTFEIAKLETKLKTTKRRPATAPEGTVERSNAGTARTSDATLARLRAQAEKTGNYTPVHEYRRKMRARAAGK